jgi:hypothetical protein
MGGGGGTVETDKDAKKRRRLGERKGGERKIERLSCSITLNNFAGRDDGGIIVPSSSFFAVTLLLMAYQKTMKI